MPGAGGNGLAAAAATARVRLRFLDFRIDIETNSLRAASRLQTYFREYLSFDASPAQVRLHAVRVAPEYDARRMKVWERPAKPDRTPKESYYDREGVRYVLKNRTGILIKLALDRGDASIAGDIDRHLNQVVNLVNTLFGLSLVDRGYAMLHASAVARTGADEALIFLGNSGSGKSSLALQLIERGGYDFVSNDRALLKVERGVVQLVGLPKKPRVNPGTLLASKSLVRLLSARKRPAYEQLSAAELWQLEDKTDVDVRRALGAQSRLSARLARAYSLEWRPSGDGLRIDDLDPAGAFDAMMLTAKDFGPFDVRRDERDMTREFRRIAKTAPFVRVTGKADPKGFARRLTAARA
jgi:HprK-related kinase B